MQCALRNRWELFARLGTEMPRRNTKFWMLALVHGEAIDLLRDQELPVPKPIGETQLDTVISSLLRNTWTVRPSNSLVIYARRHPGSDFRRKSGAIG